MKLRKVKKANGEIVSLNEVCYVKFPASIEVYHIMIEFTYTKSITTYRSMRSAPKKSRTLEFGSATTRDQELTTCTKNTVKCQEQMLSRPYTRIWQLVTEPDSGQSTYAAHRILSCYLRLM